MNGFGRWKNILVCDRCGHEGRTLSFKLERLKKGEPFLQEKILKIRRTVSRNA